MTSNHTLLFNYNWLVAEPKQGAGQQHRLLVHNCSPEFRDITGTPEPLCQVDFTPGLTFPEAKQKDILCDLCKLSSYCVFFASCKAISNFIPSSCRLSFRRSWPFVISFLGAKSAKRALHKISTSQHPTKSAAMTKVNFVLNYSITVKGR